MALKTFVKINSITNLTDARYGAGMYVNLLGFDLDSSSEKFTSPELFKEITGWVSGVDFVGEFNHESLAGIEKTLQKYPAISWIEHDRIEALTSMEGKGFKLMLRAPLEEIMHIEPELANLLNQSDITLHLVSKDDHLSEEDLIAVKKLAQKCKVILGTGIMENNVLELVENTGIYGISLSGGEEVKPGLKDMDQLADILEKLETEE